MSLTKQQNRFLQCKAHRAFVSKRQYICSIKACGTYVACGKTIFTDRLWPNRTDTATQNSVVTNMNGERDIERILVAIALAIVLIATAADFFEDVEEGSSVLALAADFIFNAFVAGTLIYIWVQRPRAIKSRNRHLEQVARHSDEDLKRWKSKASSLLEGLGSKIDEQFDYWALSKAEKEVALLLVKGVSLKELAAYRGTSEKTVRQQASSIYAKAGLDSRAELAAFFLEDLLLPSS